MHLVLMLRCQCPSVRLSVTEVHWRIIANLHFKFRSKFTAHCRRRGGGVILTTTSRAMLATARPSCIHLPSSTYKVAPPGEILQLGFRFQQMLTGVHRGVFS